MSVNSIITQQMTTLNVLLTVRIQLYALINITNLLNTACIPSVYETDFVKTIHMSKTSMCSILLVTNTLFLFK